MRITLRLGGNDQEVDVAEGASPLDIIREMKLPPDAYIVLRGTTPIPVDEVLSEGDTIRLIKVASGG